MTYKNIQYSIKADDGNYRAYVYGTNPFTYIGHRGSYAEAERLCIEFIDGGVKK